MTQTITINNSQGIIFVIVSCAWLPKWLINGNCKSPLPCLLKFFKFQNLGVSVHHICSGSELQVAAPESIISINCNNTNVFGIKMDGLYVGEYFRNNFASERTLVDISDVLYFLCSGVGERTASAGTAHLLLLWLASRPRTPQTPNHFRTPKVTQK